MKPEAPKPEAPKPATTLTTAELIAKSDSAADGVAEHFNLETEATYGQQAEPQPTHESLLENAKKTTIDVLADHIMAGRNAKLETPVGEIDATNEDRGAVDIEQATTPPAIDNRHSVCGPQAQVEIPCHRPSCDASPDGNISFIINGTLHKLDTESAINLVFNIICAIGDGAFLMLNQVGHEYNRLAAIAEVFDDSVEGN